MVNPIDVGYRSLASISRISPDIAHLKSLRADAASVNPLTDAFAEYRLGQNGSPSTHVFLMPRVKSDRKRQFSNNPITYHCSLPRQLSAGSNNEGANLSPG